MLITGLVLAAALAGHDPDGVVETARAPLLLEGAVAPETPAVTGSSQATVTHGLTTDEQIDRWIAARSADAPVFSEEQADADDRKMHSYVDAAIGTGGYRSYGAGVSLPLGDDGRLDLHYRQSENDYPLYGYGHPYFGRGGYDGFDFDGRPGRFGERGTSFGASARWERDKKRPDDDASQP